MGIKEKLEKLKKLADAMYYAAFNMTTNASLLRKAMDEYHQFIIYECYKKEPISKELEQAEKDLELTWEDIKTIDKLLNQCVDYSNPYQEVLKRFNKERKEK